MTRDQIIAPMREANLQGRWPQLCERLQQIDNGAVFLALFPIATDAQWHGPAYDAACLLFAIKPACPIPCEDAIRAMLPDWDISIEEVPWYLASCFGEEALRRAINELRDEPLAHEQRVSLDTVWYWARIFFTLTPDTVKEHQRRARRLSE